MALAFVESGAQVTSEMLAWTITGLAVLAACTQSFRAMRYRADLQSKGYEVTSLERVVAEQDRIAVERDFADKIRTHTERIANAAALKLAVRFGGFADQPHHGAWVIDQMVRVLAGDGYAELVRDACEDEGDPNAYTWETGIAP